MGTHSYQFELLKVNQKKRVADPREVILFTSSSDDNGIISDIFDTYVGDNLWDDDETPESSDAPVRFMDTYGCREQMSDEMRELFDILSDDTHVKDQVIIAIRSMGEMYHDTAKLLSAQEGSSELLSKVLSKIFKFKLEIRRGFFTGNVAKNVVTFNSKNSLNRGSKVKSVNGYVNLYVNTKDLDLKDPRYSMEILAILAVLKEKRVISKILKGEIKNLVSLVAELLSISVDRMRVTDFTYMCWNLASQDEGIIRLLATPFNTDGSDYMSIGLLAMFIYGMCKENPEVLFSWNDECRGPVDSLLENVNVGRLLKDCPDELDFSHLHYTNDEYSDDIFDEILDYYVWKAINGKK